LVQEKEMGVDILFEGKKISEAKYCDNLFSSGKGLMFSRKLKKGKSVILVAGYESRFGSAITMLSVFFPLDLIFLNSKKEVVDVRKAYPFMPLIIPKKKSKYVIEMNLGENKLKIGDKVTF
jgi:hypothetical protein